MLLKVKVIPRAKKIKIKKEADSLKVYLTVPACEGKANKLLMQVLADYFDTSKSAVRIMRGQKSRQKVIAINGL